MPKEKETNEEKTCKEEDVFEGFNNRELSYSELIALSQVYLTEWCQRDEFLWRQRLQFAAITVIVTLLPWFTSIDGFSYDAIPEKLRVFFPVAGMILSIYFMFHTRANAERLKAVGDSYRGIIRTLPDNGGYIFLNDKEDVSLIDYIGNRTHLAKLFSVILFAVTFFISFAVFWAM